MEKNSNNVGTQYELNIQNRTTFRFLIGLIPRIRKFIIHELARKIARRRGATIGEGVVLPLSLARHANHNLRIGRYTIITTDKIDLRSPVIIGSYVIIGEYSQIITKSHDIDSIEWENKNYGITIEDYVWIPVKVLILPSCRQIKYGAVIGSGSVVVKNVDKLSIVGGNPAKELRKRINVHSAINVLSLQSGDLIDYIKARRKIL